MAKYDFKGWATKADIRCTDGRTIMKDAFKDNDGKKVPLVWNHMDNDPSNVLGHAILHNMTEGVYMYGKFNETERAQIAKHLVEHGDIRAMSIRAGGLKESMGYVSHGNIFEVSLVYGGANPGALIDSIILHGEESEEDAIIYSGEDIELVHSDEQIDIEETLTHADDDKKKGETDEPKDEKKSDEKKDDEKSDDKKDDKESSEKKDESEGKETLLDILSTLNEKQQNAVYTVLAMALENGKTEESKDNDDNEGGNKDMKHNIFDKETEETAVLSHADQSAIINMAKGSGVGSLQAAIDMYAQQNESLKHGIDEIETLFPDYKDLRPGAPELIERDQSWVGTVMKKIHKSPISRIRTRQADARGADLRAKGYQKKGDQKTLSGNIKLLSRTTDPQTVYRKDELHRDDIIDITDFDVVEYQYGIMRRNLEEEIALAALIGDGRPDGDPDKIHEDHIRSIYNDAPLYTIRADVDIAAAKKELQGSNTSANFGMNYIYAEAIITAALYSREQYKGTGTPDLYCTPHLVNVMLLARDLNGRRIYDSKADLAAALNVGEIHTVEQFEGRTKTAEDGTEKKLLGIFVNLADYQIGSTKGGEITRFQQFDIDFNKEKYLIETRLSGALTRIYSAIVLEEPVREDAEGDVDSDLSYEIVE